MNLSITGGLARMTLVSPDGRNAIDPPWVEDLEAAVVAVDGDVSVRAVLIEGEGAAFTVGGDLRHFGARTADLQTALEEMVPPYHRTLARLAQLDRPVACALNGSVGGGGLGLVYAADVVLSVPSARFACGFDRLGLSGDGGSSWYLPRLVGLRRALEMVMEGRELSAAEAVEWGIVSRIVPPDDLRSQAEASAWRMAEGPTVALGHMRRLLRESFAGSVEEHLDRETAAMLDCGATADAREGVRAFVEGRRPGFSGT